MIILLLTYILYKQKNVIHTTMYIQELYIRVCYYYQFIFYSSLSLLLIISLKYSNAIAKISLLQSFDPKY